MVIFVKKILKAIKYWMFGFKCKDCLNYSISGEIDDIYACGNCKNLKKYFDNY